MKKYLKSVLERQPRTNLIVAIAGQNCRKAGDRIPGAPKRQEGWGPNPRRAKTAGRLGTESQARQDGRKAGDRIPGAPKWQEGWGPNPRRAKSAGRLGTESQARQNGRKAGDRIPGAPKWQEGWGPNPRRPIGLQTHAQNAEHCKCQNVRSRNVKTTMHIFVSVHGSTNVSFVTLRKAWATS